MADPMGLFVKLSMSLSLAPQMADPLGLFVKLSMSVSLAPLFRCLGTFSLLFLKVEMGFSVHSIALHQFWVVALGR
ncbi:hypothetical protein F2Q69_00042822 [Brassica cretica]|uniref:Uncharacterized protein n=1 Tax=Brassica cretica TaxID=69181 RepID=A0A8S9NK03_BRACR|nr:hypothetical protein F2Q69_00042822 [Brassica cretica]